MVVNIFGKSIQEEREKASMSLSDMSFKTGIPVDKLTMIENGSLFPNLDHLLKISNVLGKHQGYFLSKIVYKK